MSTFLKLKCDLWVKCDICGHAELVEKNQTDRCAVNNWIHDNNWRTTKRGQKWINICPECIKAQEEKRRKEYFDL